MLDVKQETKCVGTTDEVDGAGMKVAGTLLCCLLTMNVCHTHAATEFGENLPTRLAKLFMGIGNADGGLYSDIPDEFPHFALPADFAVLGSVSRPPGSVLYVSTPLSEADAKQAIVQAFVAEGWQELPFIGPPQGGAVFVGSRNEQAYPTILCHDGLTNLQISTTSIENEVVATINHQTRIFRPSQSCSEQVANSQQRELRAQAYRDGDQLQEYLPRLELPPEVSQGRQPGSTGSSRTSNDEASAETGLMIAWELPQVFDFFASQIAAQGWIPEGNSLTTLTAVGSWTRSPAEGVNLLGQLSVLKKADGDYRLTFKLISRSAQTGN